MAINIASDQFDRMFPTLKDHLCTSPVLDSPLDSCHSLSIDNVFMLHAKG